MPGHKGRNITGLEKYDITEIAGADVLYSPSGIILESENAASEIFNTGHTFYSAEGSTLAIKAMLAIVKSHSNKTKILASGNVHKSFVYACALLDITPVWMDTEDSHHLCKSKIDTQRLPALIKEEEPMALYVTSPDYLGNILDISALSKIAREAGIPLLVDNAHGAYLHFLEKSLHPISLGAAMCADSAHKTLSALTGGAYLHLSKDAPSEYFAIARGCMSLFASTSPSYPILMSLDKANEYLSKNARLSFKKTAEKVGKCKQKITNLGFSVEDSEPLKICINTLDCGYFGFELAEILRKSKIECEYSDKSYLVLMISPANTDRDYKRLIKALSKIPRREKIKLSFPPVTRRKSALSIREALFSKGETLSVDFSLGRICADVCVSCPPAVPIVICGEMIDEEKLAALKFYGVEKIRVVSSES